MRLWEKLPFYMRSISYWLYIEIWQKIINKIEFPRFMNFTNKSSSMKNVQKKTYDVIEAQKRPIIFLMKIKQRWIRYTIVFFLRQNSTSDYNIISLRTPITLKQVFHFEKCQIKMKGVITSCHRSMPTSPKKIWNLSIDFSILLGALV